jgi:phosphate regulon transcriptional regulator PhoB
VDDEPSIVDVLTYNLTKAGRQPIVARDGAQALRLARAERPDLVILDLMLPGIDGLEVCRRLKKNPKTASLPVIMLTAKGTETDKIVGLEVGADDYLTKPFSNKELLARIRAILRRFEKPAAAQAVVLKFKELEIDSDQHIVRVGGKEIELTAKEFQLLHYLAENQGRVFPRERLLDSVWGIDVAIETRTIDVHMRRLREKLGRAGEHLITLRGVGYKFV